MADFTHINHQGNAKMVDVSAKTSLSALPLHIQVL